jgi:uncharacterized damage-inducible protein DinB
MPNDAWSPRAAALASLLAEASAALVTVVEAVDDERWMRVPGPGIWSIGKVAAHVAEATRMHQWMVRRTIGEEVPSRRPLIERTELTTACTPMETADLIRARTLEGVTLLRGLSDEQLALPTRPPRARGELLARTIERVLIRHVDTHRLEIERRLRRRTRA